MQTNIELNSLKIVFIFHFKLDSKCLNAINYLKLKTFKYHINLSSKIFKMQPHTSANPRAHKYKISDSQLSISAAFYARYIEKQKKNTDSLKAIN